MCKLVMYWICALDLQVPETSTDDQPSSHPHSPHPGTERAGSAALQPMRSPFAAPLVGRHSHPLGAKAGIHAPRLQNPDTPGPHLPSPTSARTSRGRSGVPSGGLMQWHMSGVSSGVGLPSDGLPISPTSPEPSGMSDVSSLTSYHGVPPWPQSTQSCNPAGPSDDPSPSRHSSGWVQAAPASGAHAIEDSGMGNSPARDGSGWMEASLGDSGTHAGSSGGWVQMPWAVGDSPGDVHGRGHGPAGPSGPSSQGSFMEGPSDPSYKEWVPESRTLHEARRLMSGEIQPAPSSFEDTGGSCLTFRSNEMSLIQ